MRRQAVMLVLVALLVGAGAVSGADGPPSKPAGAPEPDACDVQRVPGLGRACLLGPGHYRLTLRDGTVLHTHGPDPVPAAGEVGFGPDAEQRPPLCAHAPHIHVLYGFPSGAPALTAEGHESIRAAVRRMNAVLQADAMETGEVAASYRVKCDLAGEIEIGTFQGPATGGVYATDYDAIVEAARGAGFTQEKTNHLIFYDAPSTSACGVANMAEDDRLSADNENLPGPNYGVVFQGCWDGRTPMHENGHNMGAVQRLAPMSDLLGHCLEGLDVMCYTSEIVTLCTDRVHFDCGHDTYFHAKPPEGSWLATHWNIGSRLNHYLAFSDTPLPETPGGGGGAPAETPDEEAAEGRGNQTTTETNGTAPADPAPQEGAGANDTIEPQAVVPDVKEEASPAEPADATIPGPPAAFLVLVLVLAAVVRRRASR